MYLSSSFVLPAIKEDMLQCKQSLLHAMAITEDENTSDSDINGMLQAAYLIIEKLIGDAQ